MQVKSRKRQARGRGEKEAWRTGVNRSSLHNKKSHAYFHLMKYKNIIIRKRSGVLKHLTIKNCDKTFRKGILKIC